MIIPGIPGVTGWYSTRQAGFDPGIIPVFPVRSQSPALPSRRRSINTELKTFPVFQRFQQALGSLSLQSMAEGKALPGRSCHHQSFPHPWIFLRRR